MEVKCHILAQMFIETGLEATEAMEEALEAMEAAVEATVVAPVVMETAALVKTETTTTTVIFSAKLASSEAKSHAASAITIKPAAAAATVAAMVAMVATVVTALAASAIPVSNQDALAPDTDLDQVHLATAHGDYKVVLSSETEIAEDSAAYCAVQLLLNPYQHSVPFLSLAPI